MKIYIPDALIKEILYIQLLMTTISIMAQSAYNPKAPTLQTESQGETTLKQLTEWLRDWSKINKDRDTE